MPDIQASRVAVPLPSAELNLGGTGTAAAQFKTASAQAGSAIGSPLVCYVSGSNRLKHRRFVVRAGGRLTGGGTTNVTVALYWGTSATIGSNTAIATTGAVASNSASGNWELECVLQWDATSLKLAGTYMGHIAAAAVARVVITNIPTAVDLSAESTANGLTIAGTFSAGFAGNILYVDYFETIPM